MEYLNIDKDCKICSGSGMTKYAGKDCHRCLVKVEHKHHLNQIEIKFKNHHVFITKEKNPDTKDLNLYFIDVFEKLGIKISLGTGC